MFMMMMMMIAVLQHSCKSKMHLERIKSSSMAYRSVPL